LIYLDTHSDPAIWSPRIVCLAQVWGHCDAGGITSRVPVPYTHGSRLRGHRASGVQVV